MHQMMRMRKILPEPAILSLTKWVLWKAASCDTPSWWMEISAVLGEDNARRLARGVRASFQLPQWMCKLNSKEAPYQAPPVLPCLNWRRFMPPVVSIFASQDFREIPQEKTIAYAWALQHWAKQNNPPVRGEPCLLVESVQELRKEVGSYLAFMDEEVFQGVDLPKEEGESTSLDPSTADVPLEHCSMPEKKRPDYAGWKKILHLSWPIVAARETPRPMRESRPRGRACQPSQPTLVRTPTHPPKAPTCPASPSPTWVSVPRQPPTPPQGLWGWWPVWQHQNQWP